MTHHARYGSNKPAALGLVLLNLNCKAVAAMATSKAVRTLQPTVRIDECNYLVSFDGKAIDRCHKRMQSSGDARVKG